ncbi:hypothetical protein L1765_08150 [Microaerobacter geothermalis]|uniref:hypothetical protein n=1 Tax=Microaerobacter geothermalis TaxID=674972 RepID=UPI001F40D4AB|nr:hypothetical protein [Microaerobacter geothermalis]MCF6093942.1 hypothetical protein [Microaerobacter geothermalis]
MPLFKLTVTMVIEAETEEAAEASYSQLLVHGMNKCEGLQDITVEDVEEIEKLEEWKES